MSLTVFKFNSNSIRVISNEGEPWFVAKDVCEVLEVGNSRQALTRLDDDEKGVISVDTPGGKQNVSIISESGLYELALSSRKPEARPFRKWVTKVVLPEIRKTGSYTLPHYADNWDNPEWQKDRQIGKGKRLTLTDATKGWIERRKAEGVKFTKAQEGKLFAAHSNALNRGVYGRSAQELRDALGIAKNDLLRDYFPQDELWAIQTVEDAAAWLVHSKDMNPIEAVNRVIEAIDYTRRFIERHKEPLPPSRTTKRLKAAPGQLRLF